MEKNITKFKKRGCKSVFIMLLFFIFMFSNFVHGQCSKYQVFESVGTAIPTSGGTWTATSVGYGTGNARTGDNQMNFNAVNDAIVTPVISNPGVFSFWYARNNNATAHSLNIQTATSTAGPWTSRGTTTTPTTAFVYQQFSVDLGALGLTNVVVRILDTRGSGTQARYIDDISWTSTSASSTLLIPALSNCSQTITSGLDYTFSDAGAANDTYNLSTDYTITFTPSVSGEKINLNFSSFDTESGYDGMVIYNGPTTSSPIFSSGLPVGTNATNCPAGSFYGTTSPGNIISTDASGAITIRFRSDNLLNNPGWLATVKCVAPVSIAASPSPSICSGSSTTLTASSTAGYTYTWSPSTGLSGTSGATVVASPTTTTTYTVTGVLGGTTVTNTITINVSSPVTSLTVTPATTSICANAIQTLTASGGITSTTAVLGTGTTSTTATTTAATLGPNPLQSYYGGTKQQMLVTAAELTALGMINSSSINTLAFNLSAVESRVLQNYTIRMQHTTLTSFATTTFVASGFTVVRNSANLTPVSGWNNITLDTPFSWNGTDNLLIEVTFSNNDTGGVGTNTALYSTTSFASSLFYRADNQTAAVVEAATTASFAAYSSRNNMRFTFTSQAPVTWSPSTELYTNVGATIAYTGTPAMTVYAKPTISRTYTATATNGACTATATSVINVNALPTASISGNNGPICSGANATFTLTGTSGAVVTYNINGGSNTTATLIGGTATVTITGATSNQTLNLVSINNPSTSCNQSLSGSSTVTVNPLPTASISGNNGPICSGANATFTLTGTSGAVVTYNINGGSTTTATLTGGTATVTITGATSNQTLNLVSINNPSTSCNQSLSGSSTVTVNPLPTASISGNNGPICSGANATFTLTGTSDAVVTYNINGGSNTTATLIGGTATVTITGATSNQTLNLVSINNPSTSCNQSLSGSSTVTVNPLPTASISGNNGPAVCSGSDITFTLTGTSGAVVTYNLNGGSNTTVTLTGGSATVTVLAATATQTLNLVSVTDGTCPATLSGSSTVVIESTTWDGTSWSNGTPTSTKAVSFTGNYTIAADLDACSISVSNNAVVSVTSGFNVNLSNTITVASGSSFTLNNNANLFQSNASAVNTGNIIVKRQTNPLIRLDYTLWSSPVTGQGLYAFSPFTFDNRFYVYNTTSNLYNNSSIGFTITGLNGAGVNGTDTANVSFATGKGYLIRLPYNHPTAPVVFNGSFTGVPNNGTKTITLANVSASQQFNAVGNPYPSPIDIDQFATDNASNIESTLYFWRKTNNTLSPSYCTWNTASATFGDNGEAYTNSPNGVIQTGQGFLVEAKDGATSLEFNNGQRIADNANQFFRANTAATPTNEAHRVWLNLTGTGGTYSQAVVGYFTNATSGADAYDSKYFNDGAIALNMVIGSTEYVIQGRPTPFQATDVVPLNYKVTTAGTYTFAIDHVDGLFTGGAQAIYIKDNQDGSYHNLSAPYTFTTAAGTFANRFELVYQTALAVDNNDFTANSINVIKQQNDVVIRTGGTTMQDVTIYDIRGRILVTKTNINASETKINVGTTNQVLLVQVTTVDGIKATKKVVN